MIMQRFSLSVCTVSKALAFTALILMQQPGFAVEDVNKPEVDGSTPLQWAVYEGDVAEVERLINAGADVDLANNYGVTPMQLASEVGNAPILKLLLEAGADADSPTADGQTALLAVARTGNLAAAQILLDHGASVNAREQWGGQSALMWASARRHPQMMELLLNNGADINARSIDRDYQRRVTAEGRTKYMDSGGFTPLLYAARENCLGCADVLLEYHADINLADPDGVSPLLLSIMNANWDFAKKLILAGADVNQWDSYGETPLFNAIGLRFKGQVVDVTGPTIAANLFGSTGRKSIDPLDETTGLEIVHLLIDHGANVNMQLFYRAPDLHGPTVTRGSTPLIRAATNADIEVVELLLDHGAEINLTTADRQTATMAVLTSNDEAAALKIMQVLHDAGQDVNIMALVHYLEGVRGGTALHYAVRKQWKDAISLLVEYGIDVNAKDEDGLTALDYTQSRGFMPFMMLQTPIYDDVAELLKSYGATVELDESPDWPIVGPPQGVDPVIWPI